MLLKYLWNIINNQWFKMNSIIIYHFPEKWNTTVIIVLILTTKHIVDYSVRWIRAV